MEVAMANAVLSDPRFFSEEAAFEYVERQLWPEGPICPHCGATANHIGRLAGVRSKPSKKNPEGVVQIGLRKCYACRGPAFTVRKGTIFEDSHLPLRFWLQAIHLLCASKKGISTRQLQRMLRCGLKTAWHLGHRIREIMKPEGGEPPLGGEDRIIEADVTFVGRKPGTKVRSGPSHMNPVMALVERDGGVHSAHVPDVKAHNLGAVLENHASSKSHFMTDEASTFKQLGWNFASHDTVNHSKDEYVRREIPLAGGPERIITTNAVEGFFSILKRGIYGVYQHVSEAHLHRYLVEFDFRYTNREKRGVNDTARVTRALRGAKGRRLTYETTGI
jgi:ISXO2-like transposase domain/Transposase zinc-ribbon domain